MTSLPDLDPIKNYFLQKLQQHGPTHRGVDYNSDRAMEIRFDQLIRLMNGSQAYSLLDWGSGYGAMLGYLIRLGHTVEYFGYDILPAMVDQGREIFKQYPNVRFSASLDDFPVADYAVLSGTFNMKLNTSNEDWTSLVLDNLAGMDRLSRKGFAFNMLTKYSDTDYMRPDLYYGDPCFFFDYCKRHFSRNVAILHDYGLYDFTILVRKDL